MSLGAIDFGMIVDGSVVMIENSVHRLESGQEKGMFAGFRKGGIAGVARPILFGVSIIIAVYLPIFTLQGLEGPYVPAHGPSTVCSALLGSLILALTAVPALSSYFLKTRTAHRENFTERWFERAAPAFIPAPLILPQDARHSPRAGARHRRDGTHFPEVHAH